MGRVEGAGDGAQDQVVHRVGLGPLGYGAQVLRRGLLRHDPDGGEPLLEQLERLEVRPLVHAEDAAPLPAQYPRDRLVGEDHQLLYELAGRGRAARPRRDGHAVPVYLVLWLPSAELQLAPPGGPRLEPARELMGALDHPWQLHLPLS